MELLTFPQLVSGVIDTFKKEKPKPETISRAIRLLSEAVKEDTLNATNDSVLACCLISTCLDTKTESELAYNYTKHIKYGGFLDIYGIILNIDGYIVYPEEPNKVELKSISINTDTLEEIGSGTYGTVYRTEDGYAVKSVKASDLGLEFSKLINELAVLKHLQGGSGIPELYFISESYPNFYVGMQLLDTSLGDILGELSPNESWNIQRDLVYALSYIHSKGIIHCDISLNNIMLDKDRNPYFIDFGESRIGPATIHESNEFGTATYRDYVLLLDQANDKYESTFGYEVDIWSLGIVLYTLEYKRSPFVLSDDYKQYADIISYQLPKVLSKVENPTFRRILADMLDMNPNTRSTASDILMLYDTY